MNRLAFCAFFVVALCAELYAANTDVDCYYPMIQRAIPCYYFRMDATSGTTQIGKGYNGASDNMTIVNSPTLNATGIPDAMPNGATTFNGTTQYDVDAGGSDQDCQSTPAGPARFCNSGTTVDYTGEAWAKTTTNADQAVFGHSGLGDATLLHAFQDVTFFNAGGPLECDLFSNTSGGLFALVTSTATYTVGQWTHVACQTTGSSFKVQIFVNGVADNTSTATTGTCMGLGPHWIIGAYGQVADVGWPKFFFNGTIDEVATYNYKLTPTVIAQHYMTGLIAFSCRDWPFTVKQERPMLLAPDGITSEALRAEAFVTKITTPDICGLPILRHEAG